MQAPPKKKGNTALIIGIVLAVLSVPCIGCIAAVAIPAFVGYLSRAKTAEATAHLEELYRGAAAYYAEEHFAPDGTVLTRCTVGSAITSNVPSAAKTALADVPPSFAALGVTLSDPVYYQYEIVSVPGCDHPAGTPLYSFRAHGDLDADGTRSLFELSAASGSVDGELARSGAILRQSELE